ncbi:DUF3165 family protein [Streptococcus pluranimalium]|uniref:DUF3165 family protein n=1 Tax=Streptococcus pluranimalium TaxID=82348 RepID=UPI0039FC3CE4
MFYLLVLLAIVLYYFLMAPKTIRSTLNSIGLMLLIALLAFLSIIGVINLIKAPSDVHIIVAMSVLGFWAFRDVIRLSVRSRSKGFLANKTR